MGSRLERYLARGIVFAGLLVVALVCSRQAVTDWRYELAGLADPFLGRPAPGLTVVVMAIGSAVVAIAWLAIRPTLQDTSTTSGQHFVPAGGSAESPVMRWWWILVAAWAGYALGAAMTVLAGGPVDHPGSIKFSFGSPVGSSAAVAATCRSAPGEPRTVTQVIPDAVGAPRIDLRNAATGEGRPYPAGTGVSLERSGSSDVPLSIPGLPDRPPMYQIGMGIDGPLYGQAIPFLAAYFYNATHVDDRGSGGNLLAAAEREHGVANLVNDLVPEDPWPERYDLAIEWTCDLDSTRPRAVPAVTVPPEYTRGPTPSLLHGPGGGIPVRVLLATTSTSLSVEIDGATIDDSTLVGLEGHDASATRTEQVLDLRQSASAAASGRTVGATFDLVLGDVTAESMLNVSVRQGDQGVGSVTFSNALGPVPLPVIVLGSQPQPVMSTPPMPVPMTWLATPIAPAVPPGS